MAKYITRTYNFFELKRLKGGDIACARHEGVAAQSVVLYPDGTMAPKCHLCADHGGRGALDRWEIRTTDSESYVRIVDSSGCPVAEKVYYEDAEWIVAQRNAAADEQNATTEHAARGEGQ